MFALTHSKVVLAYCHCKALFLPAKNQHKNWKQRSRTAHQAIDSDSALLAEAVAAVLGLAVDLGVEVHIVQDDRVRPRQIQPLPACARAEQECKYPARRVVVPAPAPNSTHHIVKVIVR